ncbi:MAG TPA: hypothetical protein VIK74_00715, partial [Parasegetibacter sp.]
MSSFNIFRRNIAIVILIPVISLSCSSSFLEVAPKGKLVAQKTNDYYFLLNSINWISTAPDAYMGDDVC